jgi:hypothetical protein
MATGKPSLRYHCVSVVAGPRACAAARSQQHVRLLSAEAPRLPLPDCDLPADCACTFRHYDDRRAGPRRAGESGQIADPWSLTERRRTGGRRETD